MRMPNMRKITSVQYMDKSDYKVHHIKEHAQITLDYQLDFGDDKSKVKYVKQIERLIRTSLEYKSLIKFLREEINMTYCSYFQNVNSNMKGVKIEIHHAPFNLFELTSIVMNRFFEEENDLNPFAIAEETMRIHFEGMVGLIPLADTVHEIVHADEPKIHVPIHFVYGDIVTFYETYHTFLSDDHKQKLANCLAVSEEAQQVPDVLQRRFQYLDVSGMELPDLK